LRNTRKTVFIIAAIVAAGMVIWLVTQDWDQRRIRKNLNRLAAVALKPRGTAIEGIDLFKRVAILRSLFTEDCVISPGEPVPQIRGLDELSAIFSQGINMVAELKVLFKDVSVSMAPGRAGATATMTAEGIGTDLQGGGRQFEAREIEMAWKKVGGKWKIALVKEVKTLH
jgi:ketosteroid isomerase-like protein